MIDSLKTLIQNKDSKGIIKMIDEDHEILELQDDNESSGFMLIAYSGLSLAFEKAIKIKKSFSFHEAIVSGDLKEVKNALKRSSSSLVNTHSGDGFTPLSLATFFDRNDIALWLLDNGADPSIQAKNPSKVNALHSAVAKENYELCEKLIEVGVDVNAVQMQNVTALHSATHRGNLEIVKLLVNNGADIETKMENGDTACSIAEREKHMGVLEYFRQHSKD